MKLKFKNDTFRIMQIADVQEGANISPDTIALINAALDKENPDLVVYSGDQMTIDKQIISICSQGALCMDTWS